MADKLDYTIQIDGDQYDVTAADSLHADLANQVEKALIVKKSVRKNLADIKDNLSLIIDTEIGNNNLRANIGTPSEAIGVDIDDDGNPIPIDRNATNAFAFKGDSKAEIEIVPSSGGVFTGPIYAPDINAGDGFNVNKFQVTNYNSVDTIIRELKGFPVYEWKRTSDPQVEALTAVTLKESEDGPPTMLPFKVVIYKTKTENFWNTDNLKKLNFTNCTTACNFLIINAKENDEEYGRTLLGTFTPGDGPEYCTYVDLRVKEADHAIDAEVAQKLKKDDLGDNITPIYLDDGTAKAGYVRAGGTGITLNGTQMFRSDSNTTADTTASFYAPTTAGETSQVLLSNGGKTDKTPTWAPQGDLSVKEAKEAQKVTEYIRDADIDDIFVKSGDKITPEVLNAYNVTGAIQGTEIGEIFNYKTIGTGTSISEVKQAAKATNAAISDKLHIYPLAGGGSSSSNAYRPDADNVESSGNYIIYGNVEPSEFTATGKYCTDEFKRAGNIYIKI